MFCFSVLDNMERINGEDRECCLNSYALDEDGTRGEEVELVEELQEFK